VKLRARAAWAVAVAASGAAALSCGSSPPPASETPASGGSAAAPEAPVPAAGAPAKAPERDAQRRVADFLARVGSVRHLRPRASVEARELDRPALIASVRQHVAREIPPDVIRNQGELLVGLGLVPPDFDYEEGAFRLLEAQLAGFYEPHDKKMYLATDLPERAADATLAHELVHALQDQHFDLGSRLAYKPEANDRESALQALAEGDATSAMMDLLLKEAEKRAIDVKDDMFAAEVEGSMTGSPDVAGVPRVLRASLVAPYVDGVMFVHALRRRGIERALAKGSATDDGGWSAVDEAWRRPPDSTEQLLHLAKYDAREPPESVPVPPPPGPGFTTAYDDVFGEEGLRIAVEEWVPKKSAAAVAKGWGGDRAALFRGEVAGAPAGGRAAPAGRSPGTSLAVAWHIRFDPGDKDPDSEAREAYKAVAEAIRPGQSAGSVVCVERPALGPLSVSRTGRDVVIVAGPYRRDGNRVASDSVCTKSLRWAADVLSKSHRQVAGK
jgi:hypothetical protein